MPFFGRFPSLHFIHVIYVIRSIHLFISTSCRHHPDIIPTSSRQHFDNISTSSRHPLDIISTFPRQHSTSPRKHFNIIKGMDFHHLGIISTSPQHHLGITKRSYYDKATLSSFFVFPAPLFSSFYPSRPLGLRTLRDVL